MPKLVQWFCLILPLTMIVPSAQACTSLRVTTTDGLVFYVRTMEGGEIFRSSVSVIPKGTEYRGTVPDGPQTGLAWTSKYGMVGMNCFGFPIITDGMNDAGLAAGNLMFPGFAEYQSFDPAKASQTIAQYEVITWILSNFATVDEVKKAIPAIRVCKGPEARVGNLELHYTVHDAGGKSIVIEYVKGELKVYDNPLGVMTNSPTFDWHMTNLANYVNLTSVNSSAVSIDGFKTSGFGQGTGMLGLPGDYTPPSRLIRMLALVLSSMPVTGSEDGLTLAMTIINNIDIPIGSVRDRNGKEVIYDQTQWTTIADLTGQKFYFRTYKNKDWRMVDVKKALASAKTVMIITADTKPDYRDVTSTAKNYGPLPAEYFPAGKP